MFSKNNKDSEVESRLIDKLSKILDKVREKVYVNINQTQEFCKNLVNSISVKLKIDR